jgi:hypothetical protein
VPTYSKEIAVITDRENICKYNGSFLGFCNYWEIWEYVLLAEIPGVARDSRKSEIIRVICLSPGSE